MTSPFPGPTPPYNNPPIHPLNYQPRRFVISDIDLGVTTTITTVLSMDYVLGQLVRLIIPETYGCRKLDETLSYVISIPSPTQVVLNLDSSRDVNEFISSTASTKAQILAVGDINTGIITSTGRNIPNTNIPGAFINIS